MLCVSLKKKYHFTSHTLQLVEQKCNSIDSLLFYFGKKKTTKKLLEFFFNVTTIIPRNFSTIHEYHLYGLVSALNEATRSAQRCEWISLCHVVFQSKDFVVYAAAAVMPWLYSLFLSFSHDNLATIPGEHTRHAALLDSLLKAKEPEARQHALSPCSNRYSSCQGVGTSQPTL